MSPESRRMQSSSVDSRNHPAHGPAARTIVDKRLIPNPVVDVGGARFGNDLPLALIAGPCQLESRDHAFEMASALKEIAARLGIGLVYKIIRSTRRTAPAPGRARPRPRSLAADLRGHPLIARPAGAHRYPRYRRNARRSPKPSTFSRFPHSCAGRPTFSSPRRRPAVSSM